MKYSFDFRVPSFESVSDCYTGAASFLSYVNSLFYSGGYAASFASCGGFVQTCYGTLQTNFYSAFCNARKSYVDCRKTNFTNTNPLNTYQSNHNAAKAASNPELRTILWMQDIGMNAPVEVTTWKSNNLTGASLTAFNNVRDDKFGIYPEKTQKIELAGPSATFTPVAVAANNTSLTKDSRYKDDILVDYNAGNMITATMNDGVPESYEWGYNSSRVIAKISNAVNKSKETLVNGAAVIPVTFQLGSNIPAYSNQFSIEQVQSGNISLAITAPPPGAQVQINYSISGPVTQTGVICNAGSGGGSCGSNTSSVTFSAMPAGQYTVTINASTSFGSYTFNNTVTCGYYGKIIQLSGLKEFFYEGFETNASAVNGNGHTGKYYYNGNYTTAFAVPNARNYVISWWKLVSGVWTYNQQAYSGPVTLTGPVDDIRICPSDAFMTTYTHDPVKGITSEMDARGRVTTYEYDPLNRLILVRDNDGNVLKKICYNFSGQAENCTTPCTNTAANWQNTANTRCQLGPDSHYTGVLEQEQMDINNCSPSYNTTRWVPAGTNTTTCPLPTYVTLTSTNTNGSPGWVASYYDTLTHYTYNLNVPTSTTLQYLGGIPAGIYNLTISRPVLGGVVSLFKSGCTRFTVSGTSVTFYNINVTASSCNSITIMPDTSN
ncbi:MAG: RHS repeat domain-containing protein [Ferruginibacter sp.]